MLHSKALVMVQPWVRWMAQLEDSGVGQDPKGSGRREELTASVAMPARKMLVLGVLR